MGLKECAFNWGFPAILYFILAKPPTIPSSVQVKPIAECHKEPMLERIVVEKKSCR